MTEQFSQEYIAFMQSDEAKALQALWEPKQWDVVWDEETESIGTLLSVSGPIVFVNFRDTDGGWLRNVNKEVVWLPMLFQLLGVIEGAGVHLQIIAPRRDYPGDDTWVVAGDRVGQSSFDKDLMLAAAKLAVKVVEGVESG